MTKDLVVKFRNFCFLSLGFLMPFSAAAISIFMILLIIATLLDKSSYKKIFNNLKTPLFQSFILFFFLHLAGFFWLEVEAINWHKSWMVWFIPILAIAVDRNTARRGIYAFVIGMMCAELYTYYNIFSIWDQYLKGAYGDYLLPISHIAYNPFLAVAIALLLSGLLAGKYRKMNLAIGIFFLITMVVNMFMTGGRAGQVGFIFIWIALSFYYLRGNIIGLSGMFISLLITLIIAWNFSPVFQNRVNEGVNELSLYAEKLDSEIIDTKENTNTSIGLRLHFYENSLELFKKSPIYGHGTGSFENTYKNFADNSNKMIFKTSNPHSNHSLILVQFGIIGMFVYLNMFIQQVRRANSMKINYEYRAVAIVLPLFFILICFYDSYIWGHHTQALFAYITAIIYRSDLCKIQDSSLQQ